jgi:hypothetical protein
MARITTALVLRYLGWSERRRRAGRGRDRGDVPGWVMVTVMTAALVVAIATIATPALQNMFSSAISKVAGIGGGGDGG